jgi:hypothetical protein
MYTSYFKHIKNIGFPVAICRFPPQDYNGPVLHLLAPEAEEVRMWRKKIGKAFQEAMNDFRTNTLDLLDVDMIIKQIQSFYPETDLGFITMICFEDNPTYCHRLTVAGWFTDNGYATYERVWSQRKYDTKIYKHPPFGMMLAEKVKGGAGGGSNIKRGIDIEV